MAAWLWTYNGFSWGDAELPMMRVSGLLGFDVESQSVARYDRGSTPGRHRQLARTFTFDVDLRELTVAEQRARLDAARLAWAPRPDGDELPLTLEVDGTAKVIACRPIRHNIPIDHVFAMADQFDGAGLASMSVQFEATDPYLYNATPHAVATARAVPGAGVAVPFTVPFTIPAPTSTGAVDATNSGTVPAPWTARLEGPVTNPRLTHVGTGRYLDFSANGGLDLAAGQWVDLDSRDRSVLLNGTGDRRVALTFPESRWFDLDVGANSVIFEADAGAGQLTFTHQDAWAA